MIAAHSASEHAPTMSSVDLLHLQAIARDRGQRLSDLLLRVAALARHVKPSPSLEVSNKIGAVARAAAPIAARKHQPVGLATTGLPSARPECAVRSHHGTVSATTDKIRRLPAATD